MPELIVGLVLGQVGYQGMLILGSQISADRPWLALGAVSLGFSALLVGYLYALRALGRHFAFDDSTLGVDRDAPQAQESLTHLVAVTLLPFLGIYAVFGKVQETSFMLHAFETVARGELAASVLTNVNPQTGSQMLIVVAVLAGAYLVRRLTQWLHKRTGARVFGFATGIVETFFMFLLVFGGTRVISTAVRWLQDRMLAAWVSAAWDGVSDVLRSIHSLLPGWIEAFWAWLFGPVWNTFVEGLGAPLLWLAIAALAFGSRLTNLQDLWGQTLGSRAKLPTSVDRLASPGAKRFGAEFKELVLGDMDDKYLPTWYSLRLVLASGASFIGAFALVHALVSLLEPGLWWLTRQAFGPREGSFWVQMLVGSGVAATLIMEPLRLSLLAVAFNRCIRPETAQKATAREAVVS